MEQAIGIMECDACLDILRAGLQSKENKAEWEKAYNLHLASAHGTHLAAQVEAPSTREQLQEFWRTFRLPENASV
ncbi:MAG TPA: hypothetical protein VEC02_02455 [Nitrososphaerales archaeon]|nr:hypothetical protein [Nitrososphaerales archaeon]